MNAIVEKVLSSNDTGETGAHQAGLFIPSEVVKTNFFPTLNASSKNPRTAIDFRDIAGEEWTFNYVYYNNAYFGGTRDEYRLTRMTRFLRHYDLRVGDTVIFKRLSGRVYEISYRRKNNPVENLANGKKVLRLTGNWVVIDTDELV